MNAAAVDTDALLAILTPELRKLLASAPRFGSISLKADLHDGDIGRISLAVEASRRIAPRAERGGRE